MACRQRGMNRYEVHAILRERRDAVPSPSTIYRTLKRYGLNHRTPAMREEKRRIIKDKLGELGHVDLHQLPRDIFLAPPPGTAYCRQPDRQLLAPGLGRGHYLQEGSTGHVQDAEDDQHPQRHLWARLCTRSCRTTAPNLPPATNREEHPFEAMLLELGIKHRYTRPYRPQTNGKIERFWRTIDDDAHRGHNLRQSRSLRKRAVRIHDLLQQATDPIRPLLAKRRRPTPQPRPPRSNQRIVNIDSNDGCAFRGLNAMVNQSLRYAYHSQQMPSKDLQCFD